MKQFLLVVLLSLSVIGAGAQNIPARPNPPRLVNDFTNLLDPGQIQQLERKLDTFDDSTSIQIAVVIIASTQDYDPVDYCVKLGRTWGVGNKEFNNGVVFLIARDDHKTFIAPGYGLEGVLPDITCKEIVDNEVLPNFKSGDFYAGIDGGVNALIQASKGEYKAPAGYHSKSGAGGGAAILIIIGVIVLIIIIRSRGGGGGGGGYMSRRGYSGSPFLWGAAGGFLGSSLGGGGGFGSGGGGGGGFGGFGGGSFGGGGAGGSW